MVDAGGDLDRSQSWGFAEFAGRGGGSGPGGGPDAGDGIAAWGWRAFRPGPGSGCGCGRWGPCSRRRIRCGDARCWWPRPVGLCSTWRGWWGLLRLDDGSVEWIVRESRREGAGEPGSDLTATIVPLVEKGAIYAVVGPRTAACLDWEDGRREWTAEFDEEVEAAVACGKRIVAFAGRSLTGVHIWSGKPMSAAAVSGCGDGAGVAGGTRSVLVDDGGSADGRSCLRERCASRPSSVPRRAGRGGD